MLKVLRFSRFLTSTTIKKIGIATNERIRMRANAP